MKFLTPIKAGFLLVFGLLTVTAIGQEWDWDLKTSAEFMASNQDQNPFWFYANSFRQRGELTDFNVLLDGQVNYRLSENAVLEAGAAVYYRNEVPDEFQRRDLYVEFRNTWLKATVGSQSRPVLYEGISLTNRNFLNSGNARPLPGVLLEAPKLLRLSDNFGLDWGIGHYVMNDDRFVEDTWVHYKRLGINYQFLEKNQLLFQVKHFAQWAGTSPSLGDLPDDFEAFVDVFFARRAPETGEDGEFLNAVGNHLGTYLLSYTRSFDSGRLELYHEHPFEDGSGTRLANFPDGTWGANYLFKDPKVIKAVLYEFVYTLDQTSSETSGVDNYFSNSVYRSGWSYEEQIVGMPLILFQQGWEPSPDTNPIISNRVRAHHFGFLGSVGLVNWKLKSTFVDQLGTSAQPADSSFWFNYVEASYGTFFGELTFKLGLDAGNSIDTTFGGGIQYRYTF